MISILVHGSMVIHSLLSVPGEGLDIGLHDDLLSRVLGGFVWCLGRDRNFELMRSALFFETIAEEKKTKRRRRRS